MGVRGSAAVRLAGRLTSRAVASERPPCHATLKAMPTRQYRFTYSGTITVEDADVVEAVLHTSGPVDIQGTARPTDEQSLNADLVGIEMIRSALPDHLRVLVDRLFLLGLGEFSRRFHELLPEASIDYEGTTVEALPA